MGKLLKVLMSVFVSILMTALYFPVSSFAQSTLPTGWASVDIGSPTNSGSTSYDGSTNQFSLTGSGNGIVGTSTEQYQFAYEPESGNFTVVAQVSGITSSSAKAQAGLLVRNGLDNTSTYQGAFLQASTTYPPYDMYYSNLTSVGGTINNTSVSKYKGLTGFNLPEFIRIRRQLISGQKSDIYVDYGTVSNGTITWTNISGTSFSDMLDTVYAGLVVSSGDATTSATATFDDVSITNSFDTSMTTNVSSLQPPSGSGSSASSGPSPIVYAVNDTFDSPNLPTTPTTKQNDTLDGYDVTVGSNLSGVTFNPALNYAQIASDPLNPVNKTMYLNDDDGPTHQATKITKSFTAQNILVDAQLDFLEQDTSQQPNIRFLDLLDSSGHTLIDLETNKVNNSPALTMRMSNGSYVPIVPNAQMGQWYHVKVQLDLVNQTADVTISDSNNQTYSLLQQPLYQSGTNVAGILMETSNTHVGHAYFDNVQVYVPNTPPNAPIGLTAKAGNTQVGLSWNAASGATSYTLYRGTQSGGPYTAIATGLSKMSYIDTGLTNNTTYYYAVSGTNFNGEGPKSKEVSATPNDSVPLPAKPTGVTTVQRDSEVTISWNPVQGADTYILKRSTTQGGPYTVVADSLTSPTYLDRDVKDGTTYYYVVAAYSLGGIGPDSDAVAVTPTTPIPAPSGLSATASNNQVALSWSAPAGTGYTYTVERSIADGGPYTPIASNLSTTSYTDASALNGTTYYYVVTDQNAVTESIISNQVSATPYPAVPGAPAIPAGLTAKAGDGLVTLSWDAQPDATTYTVKRSLTSGGPYETIADNLASTSYVDPTVTDGTKYYYVVTAVNGKGESGNSREVIVEPARVIVVAQDGSGDFTTINAAVASIPADNRVRTVIYVKEGTYHEKVQISQSYVSLVGEDRDGTVIVNSDYGGTNGQSGNVGGTFNSYTVQVTGDHFTAQNITIENDAPRATDGTAVALDLRGDQDVFNNVRIKSHQDTLYTGYNKNKQGREYFYNSIIEGDVDFIFGEAPAVVFNHDTLVTVGSPGTSGGGHVTAAAQLAPTDPGYVFLNSTIEPDSSTFGKYTLGRPWKNYPSVRFINTMMKTPIDPAGWSSWNVPPEIYGEYNSMGPGADPSARQIGIQLSAAEASALTIPRIFDGWDPSRMVIIPTSPVPHVTPQTLVYNQDAAPRADVKASVESYGDTFVNVTNGSTTVDPKDYTIDGNSITIRHQYLDKLPVGTAYLLFHFQSGSLAVLKVNMVKLPVLPPQNLRVPTLAFDDHSVTLVWNKPSIYSNIADYEVYMNGNLIGKASDNTNSPAQTYIDNFYKDPANTGAYPISSHSYTVTGLSPNTKYTFTVKSVSKDGRESIASQPVSVTTLEHPKLFDVMDYGAVGDGTSLDTAAIQKAIDAAAPGGTVLLPAGYTFKSGALWLKSDITLEVDGTLLGSDNATDYGYSDPTHHSVTNFNGLINAIPSGTNTLQNIRIVGSGKIDGSGWKQGPPQSNGLPQSLPSSSGTVSQNGLLAASEYNLAESYGFSASDAYSTRSNLIDLSGVSNVYVGGGLTLENPAQHVMAINADNVTLDGVIVASYGINNGDGIDFTGNGLVVTNSVFDTGDDDVNFAAGEGAAAANESPTQNIWVFDNFFGHGHGAVVAGSHTGAWIENVLAEDNVLDGTGVGLRLKSTPAMGGGAKDITFRDTAMKNITDGDGTAFEVISNYGSANSGFTPASTPPVFKNIHVMNVTVDTTAKHSINIVGLQDAYDQNLHFANVSFANSQPASISYLQDSSFNNVTFAGMASPWEVSNSTDVAFNNSSVPSWPSVAPLSASEADKSVTLTWEAATAPVGIAAYEIYEGDKPIQTVAGNGPGNTMSYTVPHMNQSPSVTFRVLAVDAAGDLAADVPSVTITK